MSLQIHKIKHGTKRKLKFLQKLEMDKINKG